MKKVDEINLTVGRDLSVSPHTKQKTSHNGGFTNSADNTFGGMYMSRVNKGYPTEEEEYNEDEVDEEIKNLIKEISMSDLSRWGTKGLNLGKSAVYSIPGVGDALASVSFLWSYFGPWGLRSQVKGFTRKLSKLSDIELGNDFLEAEGKIEEDAWLDGQLDEVVYRMTNLKDMPDLDIAYEDIVMLEKEWDDINDKIRDILIDFIGFADALTFQQGIYLNVGLSMLDPEDVPDFIIRKYADWVRSMTSEDKNIIYKAASKGLAAAGKPLDYLGNVDLLLNPDKLSRLGKIQLIFDHFDGISTEEEMAAVGLNPGKATLFTSQVAQDAGGPTAAPEDTKEKQAMLTKAFKSVWDVITENGELTLKELYADDLVDIDEGMVCEHCGELHEGDCPIHEDDELEEYSAGGVGGAAVPMGKMHRAGTPNYTKKDIENFHNYAHRTYGKIK